MTLQERHNDARDHLTWLIGALARALFRHAEHDATVMGALQRLAACSPGAAPLTSASNEAAGRADARKHHAHRIEACHFLPQAAVDALRHAQEAAMALAAALEHLRWQAMGSAAAIAEVAGPEGRLLCNDAALRLLITAPGCRPPISALRLPGAAADEAPVLFVLSGAAHVQDVHGALRHVAAGQALQAGSHALQADENAPLLACLLRP